MNPTKNQDPKHKYMLVGVGDLYAIMRSDGMYLAYSSTKTDQYAYRSSLFGAGQCLKYALGGAYGEGWWTPHLTHADMKAAYTYEYKPHPNSPGWVIQRSDGKVLAYRGTVQVYSGNRALSDMLAHLADVTWVPMPEKEYTLALTADEYTGLCRFMDTTYKPGILRSALHTVHGKLDALRD